VAAPAAEAEAEPEVVAEAEDETEAVTQVADGPILPDTETDAEEDIVLPATNTPVPTAQNSRAWMLLAPFLLLLLLFREKLYSPVKGRLVGRDELDEMGITLDDEHDMLFVPIAQNDGYDDVVTAPANAKIHELDEATNTITFKTKFGKLITMKVNTSQDLTDQFDMLEVDEKVKKDDILFRLNHCEGVHVAVTTDNKAYKVDVRESQIDDLDNAERIAHFKIRERKHEEPTMTPAGGHA
jgi:hypothetical protein